MDPDDPHKVTIRVDVNLPKTASYSIETVFPEVSQVGRVNEMQIIHDPTELNEIFSVGLIPSEEPKPFTLEECLNAVEILRRANVPTFEGCYFARVTPWEYEFFVLQTLVDIAQASYRLETTAWSIFHYEEKRWRAGKREMPRAREVMRCAVLLEIYRGEYIQRLWKAKRWGTLA
jgi:hypothetical protein